MSLFLKYLAAGICLIPQTKEGMPLVKWGQYFEELPSEGDCIGWDASSASSYGLLCGKVSNIIAVDVDTDDNAKISIFLESPVKKIGSKGYTAFFKYNGEDSKSWKCPSSKKVICELLSNKRLTTIPPSPHRVTGIPYVWDNGLDLLDVAEYLPVLPDDFFAFMDIKYPTPAYTQPSNNYIPSYDSKSAVDLDQCHDMLAYISADLCRDEWVKVGMAMRFEFGDAARGLWHDWSRSGAGSTKYNPRDADNAWRSFNGAGTTIATLIYMATQGGYEFPATAREEPQYKGEIHFGEDSPVSLVAAPPPITYPKVHGLVGEITEWIMETARMPQYPLALGAALAFVGALKGHRVQTETGLRTNLFILSVAPSGAGKDHPRKCIEILARDSGLSSLIGGEPASGSGLVDGLYNAGGRQLIQLDEIGRFLKGITNPNAQGFYTEIGTNWMKLFSSASSMYYGKSYANNGNKKIEPRSIDNPCLCINGSTTATRLYEAMTGADVIDGFLNRWIVIECNQEVEPIKGKGRVDEAPEHLVQQVRSIQAWPTQMEFPQREINIRIQPKVVPFNIGAYQLLEEYEEQFNVLRKATNDPEGLGLLWARASEHMKKVALVVGGYDCIKDQDVEFAFQLVKQCVTLIIDAVQTHVASSEFERNKKRILAIIKGKGGICSLQTIASNSHFPQRIYKEILTTLQEGGAIEGFTKQGKTFFKLV